MSFKLLNLFKPFKRFLPDVPPPDGRRVPFKCAPLPARGAGPASAHSPTHIASPPPPRRLAGSGSCTRSSA